MILAVARARITLFFLSLGNHYLILLLQDGLPGEGCTMKSTLPSRPEVDLSMDVNLSMDE